MDRRTFLLGSAAAAGSALAQSSGEPVRTAMIGVGNRGSYLLRGVLEQPNAKVVALCDIKPDRLDKAASAAAKANPKTFKDWRAVIDLKDVDAVYVATPPNLHSEMAMAALKAGKHVYCEKPIGVTPAQVRDLVKVARQTKKVFHAGQQLRSMSQYITAVEKIHRGEIGDILMIKAQRHATEDISHDGSSGDWYFNFAKSGGYLIEQSVHNLDLCNWVIGAHPVKAVGFGGTNLYKNDPPGRDIMDNSSITYDYPNGVKMSFTQQVFHPRGLPAGGQYVYVYGSKGAVDLMNSPSTFYPRGEGKPSLFAEKGTESPHAHIEKFYRCVLKGEEDNTGIIVGATAALTAYMGSECCIKQRMIKWDEFGVDF